MTTISAKIPDKIAQNLKNIAQDTEKTVDFHIIRALEDYLDEKTELKLVSINAEELLNLAGKVFDDLSNEEIDQIKKTALDRNNFFGDRR